MVVHELHRTARKGRLLNSVVSDGSNKVGGSEELQSLDRDASVGSIAVSGICSFDDEVGKSWTAEEILGESMGQSPVTLQTMAQTDSPVLIVGEHGTCKEVVARSLHSLSHYACFPFVHVNCELVQREGILAALLGLSAKTGCQPSTASGEASAQGPRTVFLEGISKLSLNAQEAVFSILELQHGDGPGFVSLLPERVRVIASSDVDLLETIKKGAFLQDLYRHLNVHLIEIPALRGRVEDMSMLVQRFLDQDSRRQGQPCRLVSTRAVELMQLYPWPGNLRELWHVLARFTVLRQAAQESLDARAYLSDDQPDLCSHLHLISETEDLDDAEIIVAALLQTVFLRSS